MLCLNMCHDDGVDCKVRVVVIVVVLVVYGGWDVAVDDCNEIIVSVSDVRGC